MTLTLVPREVTEQEEIRKALREDVAWLLAQIDAGEVKEFFGIAKRRNNEWAVIRSGTLTVTDMVGKIEVAKHDLIRAYRER